MAVTDYKYAGTAANVDRGSDAWSNPDYAKADDTNYSTVAYTYKNTSSDWLLLTNFGFTSSDIPSGSTINGIEFIICRAANYAGYFNDSAVYLYNSSAVGNNLASAGKYPQTTQTEATYGGATNMCGTSLTQSDIVSSNFGVELSTYCGNTGSGIVYVDYIKIRVYYTASGGSTSLIHPLTRKPFKHMIVR